MKKEGSFNIEISLSTIIKTILVLAGCWLLFLLRDVVLVLVAAIVLASALEPGTAWLEKRNIPRVASVIAMYFVMFVITIGIIYLVAPTLLREVSNLLNHLPTYIDSLQSTADDFSLLSFDLKSQLADISTQNFSSVGGIVTAVGGGFLHSASFLFGGLFSFTLIIVLSFYLAVQKRGIENFLRLVTHEDYEPYVLDLWRRSQIKIGLWMQGQLILGFFMGVFVYLGLTALGIKYQLLLALLAALCELIPVFGPIIAAVPAVAIGFLDTPTAGIITLVFYILIQQVENHIVYPLVVRKIVGLSPMVVIVSLVVGGQLAGFLGVLLAVPLASVAMELLNDLEKHKTMRRAANSAQ